MNRFLRFYTSSVIGTFSLMMLIHAPIAGAASLTSLGHNAGAQCGASDVNDSGISAGVCSASNVNGPRVAWVAQAGQELPLPALAVGRSCYASGITNGNAVVGQCLDLLGVNFAVVWNPGPSGAGVISQLLPRPGIAGLFPDVSTTATAYNQNGDVVGVSGAGNRTSTAVLWRRGSTTVVGISVGNDNCIPVDVGEPVGTSNPTVLLNCPSGTGTVNAVIAVPGLLGLYQMTTLAKASGASFCTAGSMNAASRIMGTCVFPTAPTSRVAYWVSPAAVASAPLLTVGSVPVKSSGAFLNAAGNIVLQYQTPDGKSNAAYLAINSAGAVTNFVGIPPLHSGTTVRVTGFGDNGLVTVEGKNTNENAQAAVWDPAFPGALSPVPLYGGGASNRLSAVSKSGSYAVGVGRDSSHVENAVVTALP
jgi:hypothetical protein